MKTLTLYFSDFENRTVAVYGRLERTGSIQKTKIFTEFETREKALSNAPSGLKIGLLEAENELQTKLEQKWNIFLSMWKSYSSDLQILT